MFAWQDINSLQSGDQQTDRGWGGMGDVSFLDAYLEHERRAADMVPTAQHPSPPSSPSPPLASACIIISGYQFMSQLT